jgi:hypothetical protein
VLVWCIYYLFACFLATSCVVGTRTCSLLLTDSYWMASCYSLSALLGKNVEIESCVEKSEFYTS